MHADQAELFDASAESRLKGRTMAADFSLIQFDGAQALTQTVNASIRAQGADPQACGSVGTKTDEFIALIESRAFIRECIRRSMQSALPLQIRTFSQAIELQRIADQTPKLILLSALDDNNEPSESVFKLLSQIAPSIPIIVLAYKNDTKTAKAAISYGAKGYIPVTSGFEITIEAVRFVLAGGIYVPVDYLFMTTWAGDQPSNPPPGSGPVTARELAVVRAIQLGKSNKVIAYELGMCEGTVKVHLRRIMKKIKARNRTEVAIKSSELLRCLHCEMQGECWSAGRCARIAHS